MSVKVARSDVMTVPNTRNCETGALVKPDVIIVDDACVGRTRCRDAEFGGATVALGGEMTKRGG